MIQFKIKISMVRYQHTDLHKSTRKLIQQVSRLLRYRSQILKRLLKFETIFSNTFVWKETCNTNLPEKSLRTNDWIMEVICI